MKIFNEEYTVYSSKISKNYIICLLSDLHITKSVPEKLIRSTIESIKIIKPDYIVISGDMINWPEDLLNEENKQKLEQLFRELSLISPIYFIMGNHDLRDGKKLKVEHTIEYYKSLEEKFSLIGNHYKIKLLNNDYELVNDDIMMLNFSPRMESYYEKHQKEWEDYYIEDFDEKKYLLSNKYFNIMILHSPHTIYTPRVQRELKASLDYIDLYLSGHAHGGMTPKILISKGIIKTSKGICCGQKLSFKKGMPPFLQIFEKCRGIHDVGTGKMIVSSGLRTFTAEIPGFALIDRTWSHDITTIKLIKK